MKYILNRYQMLINEANKERFSYGCVMLKIEEGSINDLLSKIFILDEDVFLPNNPQYGFSKNPHITILYGLLDEKISNKDDVLSSLEPVKSYLKEVKIKNISLFENDEFDVLKFDIDDSNGKLAEANKIIADKFEFETSYPDYHPHLTICYLNKGEGKKYIEKYGKEVVEVILKASKLIYSYDTELEIDL